MGWFRVASSRLTYRGRLSKAPFSEWAGAPDGVAAIDERARRDGLRVFAHGRARRRMWRELEAVTHGEPFRGAVQAEANHFAATLIDASYAPGLPRLTVALHRLVIVPRTIVAGRMRMSLRRRSLYGVSLAALDPHVREFFCEQLLAELDAAIAQHQPTASRPILTQDVWGCVGHHTEYEWIDPMFSGERWGGHFLMYEFPRQGLSRRDRKDLDQAVREIQSSLSNISRNQRHAIVQMAVDGLPRATA